MMDWITHDGFRDPPLAYDVTVEVMFRDGDTATGPWQDWDQNWQWQDSEEGRKAAGAIVSYRPLSPNQNGG